MNIIQVHRYQLQRVHGGKLCMTKVVERDPIKARKRVNWRDAWVTLIDFSNPNDPRATT